MKVSSKLAIGFVIICFFLLEVIIYHQIVGAYFVGEDYEWWTRVRDLDFLSSVRLFIPRSLGGLALPVYYRPLVGWTVWVNTVLMGMRPSGFHLTSLFFHLVNVMLVYCLGYLLFHRSKVAGLLSGLFFSVFPYHSEAVVWSVGGRYDLVFTTFYLLGMLSVLKYLSTKWEAWKWITYISFILSLLSKESAITFPLAVAGLMLVDRRSISIVKIIFRYINEYKVLLYILLIYILFRALEIGFVNPLRIAEHINFGVSRLFYLYLLGLSVVLFVDSIWLKSVVRGRWKRMSIVYVLLMIGVTFLPTAFSPTQERQLYLPSVFGMLFIGFSVVVVHDLLKKYNRKVVIAFRMLLMAVVVANGLFLYSRNLGWKRAGDMAFRIAESFERLDIADLSGEKVYFVNVVDSIDGVYIYRTHLEEALEFKTEKEIGKLVMVPTTIGSHSSVEVISSRELKLFSKEGFLLFQPNFDEDGRRYVRREDFRAVEMDDNTLLVTFLDPEFDIKKDRVFAVEGNQVRRLKD